MLSLGVGALLSRVCCVLKSRLATPASCLCRFAFGAARTNSELVLIRVNLQHQTDTRKKLRELTEGLIIQQVLYVRYVVSWTLLRTFAWLGSVL